MKALVNGIYTLVAAHENFNGAITNGLHPGSAPQNTALPMAYYNIIDSEIDIYFANEYHEEYMIQLSIFSDTDLMTEVNTIAGYARNCFDNCKNSLVVSGYKVVDVTLMNGGRPIRHDEGGEEAYWQYVLFYKIYLLKN